MTWSPAFIEEISKPVCYPQFRVEQAAVPGYLPGSSINLSSHGGSMGAPHALLLDGSSIQAGTLHPIEWSYSSGTATLAIKSNTDVRRDIPRGALVRLMMGFRGWSDEQFEPIFFGVVANVVGTTERFELHLNSVISAVISRFSQIATASPLFYDLATTTLTVAYGVGDPTITVGSTTGLERLTGESYLVQIDSNSFGPVFLIGSAKSPTTVDVSATGTLGTDSHSADIGNTVTLCAFVEKNPVDAVLVLLTSTGTGTGGAYDLAPNSWSFRLPLYYIDVADCATTKTIITPAAGAGEWGVYSTVQQDNGAAFIQSILQPAGMWLCERQGMLTIRGVQEINGGQYETEAITDDDLVEINIEAWDPTQQAEYGGFSVVSTTGSTFNSEGVLDSRPAISELTTTLPYCHTDESDWRSSVSDRLKNYAFRVGEMYTMVLRGWRLAKLTPGDEVRIYSRYVTLRQTVEAYALVLSVEPDWFGSTTRIVAVMRYDRLEP